MIEVPIPYSERAGRSKLNVMRDGRCARRNPSSGPRSPTTACGRSSHRPGGQPVVTLLVGVWLLVQRLQGVTR